MKFLRSQIKFKNKAKKTIFVLYNFLNCINKITKNNIESM